MTISNCSCSIAVALGPGSGNGAVIADALETFGDRLGVRSVVIDDEHANVRRRDGGHVGIGGLGGFQLRSISGLCHAADDTELSAVGTRGGYSAGPRHNTLAAKPEFHCPCSDW